MRWAAAFSLGLLAAGCTTYVTGDPRSDLRFVGRDWGTAANEALKLRGHTYRADVRTAWRRLHATLGRFGLRPTHEVAEPQWQISQTTHSTKPASALKKLLSDARGKLDRRWKITKARYYVSAALVPVTHARTQVAIRVFPELYVIADGMSNWRPVNPNGEFLKALYKDLDRRMPAYRDKSQPEWQGW